MTTRVAYKYDLTPDAYGVCSVFMPKGARVLHVDAQAAFATPERYFLWALVDSPAPSIQRDFAIVGTGQEFDATDLHHIGTFLAAGGAFVWHVFEHYETPTEVQL